MMYDYLQRQYEKQCRGNKEIYPSFFEMKYTPTKSNAIPMICIVVINSLRTRNANIAAKNGVDNSRPDTCAAFNRFNPS